MLNVQVETRTQSDLARVNAAINEGLEIDCIDQMDYSMHDTVVVKSSLASANGDNADFITLNPTSRRLPARRNSTEDEQVNMVPYFEETQLFNNKTAGKHDRADSSKIAKTVKVKKASQKLNLVVGGKISKHTPSRGGPETSSMLSMS